MCKRLQVSRVANYTLDPSLRGTRPLRRETISEWNARRAATDDHRQQTSAATEDDDDDDDDDNDDAENSREYNGTCCLGDVNF